MHTPNPPISIRRAGAGDMEAVHALVRELAEFEKAPEAVITDAAQYARDGFGPHPWFECLIAETPEHQIVGAAVFYSAYSTWKGRMVYLDDLIVTERYRRQGIGSILFDHLVRHARDSGARQLRWHVLDWNEPAIRFYRKIQASLDGEWITCKLEQEQLQQWP